MLSSSRNKQSITGGNNDLVAALKCPRCGSPKTKFCYYNNYNLSQPRHFCKTCRRHWTRGGALRNVPVGGGCRKNKKPQGFSRSDPPDHDHALSLKFFQCTPPAIDFQFEVDAPANPSFTVEPNSVQPVGSLNLLPVGGGCRKNKKPQGFSPSDPPEPDHAVSLKFFQSTPPAMDFQFEVEPNCVGSLNLVPSLGSLYQKPQQQEIGAASVDACGFGQFYDNAYQVPPMSTGNLQNNSTNWTWIQQ